MFSAFQTFGRLGAGARAVAAAWSPTTLFSAGEAGGLWDFSTLANLYQDSAGTTPCTAVGDPIGKVLDTSGRGNHLTQSTSTKRPTLGRMPATGVRNLFTQTESLSNPTWEHISSIGTNPTNTSVLDPEGGNTGVRISEYTNTGNHVMYSSNPGIPSPGGKYYVTFYAKEYGRSLKVQPRGDGSYAAFDLVNGLAKNNGSQITGAVISAQANGWWKCGFYLDRPYDIQGLQFNLLSDYAAVTTSYTGDGTSGVALCHPQFEAGATATAYQKVGAVYDVTESGVASVYTAYFDGVDDCLVSPSIDFSGTDAMSVFSGFRKTSDAARGMVAELSATTDSNNGSFALTAPNAASATIVYESKGTSLTDTSATIAAPADSVISAVSDISADSNVLRRNGAQTDSDTGDQGTGNFGNYPIYVGQRAATSLPYKGFISALCTRGAATDAATVTSMEKWMAARTPGVTLP